MDIEQFEERKLSHIQHSLDPSSQASGLSGLDGVRLIHEALPEQSLEDVRLQTECLGSPLETPFFIAGMTAGHPRASEINRLLGTACAELGWAMGVGSQRRQLGEAGSPEIDQWKALRRDLPRLKLFSNIGISQLIHAPMDRIRGIVESVGADAIAVHLNALQECMQPEGTPQFKGALKAIEKLVGELEVPVIVKETGCGMSRATLKRLAGTGVRAIDVSGLGGTHWGRIEGARAESRENGDWIRAQASRTFANWGNSTVDSVLGARETLPREIEIWASGGVRSGLDAAKLIALGAHRIGYARPALEAVLQGLERGSATTACDELRQWMRLQEFELRVALFCTGTSTPGELREREGVWTRNAI